MSILAFMIGVGITTLVGWLAVGAAQGRTPVLSRYERLAWGLTLGPTLGMFSVFLCHVLGLTKLNLTGFLAPQLFLIAILGIFGWKLGTLNFRGPKPYVSRQSHPRWMTIGIGLLCIWTAIKIIAGAYDLISVPTYWDDSFNNWNMRGKIFYMTEELQLEIPGGNGVIVTAGSVGSYPPTLPLMKTFVSVLRGAWHEPLVNSVHLVWFIGLLSVLYFTLRRSFDPLVSALGIWAIVSLPLILIHGNNPYADIFVAAHVLLAASALLALRKSHVSSDIQAWTKLFFLTLGLLVFTKNEALLLHVPLLCLAAVIFEIWHRKNLALKDHRKTLVTGLCIAVAFALPWLSFKWMNGLTFGNAKSVSGVSLTFNPVVLKAIWFHLTHEANWLLLPLVLPLALIAAGRRFWRSPEAVLGAFVLADIALQFMLFIMIQALATEAINQTGLSRGLLQVAPVAVLVIFSLWAMMTQETN